MEEHNEVEILRGSNIKQVVDEGTTPTNFLRTLGIAFNDQGPIFDEAGATNVSGLYLIGDLVVGKKGGSIVTAFNSAVHAMKRICMHDLPCNSSRSEALSSNRISSAWHPLVGT